MAVGPVSCDALHQITQNTVVWVSPDYNCNSQWHMKTALLSSVISVELNQIANIASKDLSSVPDIEDDQA